MQDLAEFDKGEFDILVAKCGKTIGLKGEIKLIIYSDFLEVFTKGNVFLCKGVESSKKKLCEAPENSPASWCKKSGEASSSASADFLLEAEKRGSPPKSEKRQLLARRGSGVGGAALLREKSSKNNGEGVAESGVDFVDSANLLKSGLPRSPALARNDDFLDSAFFLTLQSFNPHKNSATFAEITSIERAKNLTSMLLFSTKSLTQKQCALSENEYFWFEIIGRSVVENGERIGVVSEIERIGSIDYLIIEVDCKVFAKYPHIKAKRFYLPYISRYVLSAENGAVAVQDALLVLESS